MATPNDASTQPGSGGGDRAVLAQLGDARLWSRVGLAGAFTR